MKKNLQNNYIKKYSLKSEILYKNAFLKAFTVELKKEWDLIYLDLPLVAYVKDSFFCNDFIQRKIEFDSIGIDLFYFIITDHSIWIRNQIIQLDLKPNQGIYAIYKKIKRDGELFNTNIEQNIFHLELVVLEGDDNNKIITNVSHKIITMIVKVISEIKIFNELTKQAEIIDKYIFLNKYTNKDFLLALKFYPFFNNKNFINDFIAKNNFCLIHNIYKNLKQNLFFDDFYLYGINLKQFSKFFFYNSINEKVYNLFDISIRPNIDEIYFFIDQLKVKKDIVSDQVKSIVNSCPKTVSFDLNLDLLYMFLFSKDYFLK